MKRSAHIRTACRLVIRMVPLLFCTLGAYAAGPVAPALDQRALLERLVQCKASINEVVMINDLLIDGKVTLPEADKAYTQYGGSAWRLTLPIQAGGLSSDVVVMNGRNSFYLYVRSKNPAVDSRTTAQKLQLGDGTGDASSMQYRKETGDRSQMLMTLGSDMRKTPDYWLGCSYDQDAVSAARRQALDASPERLANKRRLQQVLRGK